MSQVIIRAGLPKQQTRALSSWSSWISNVFNRVDSSRIRKAGPDRALAEYALRMDGRVAIPEWQYGLQQHLTAQEQHEHEHDAKQHFVWVKNAENLPKEGLPLTIGGLSLDGTDVTDIGMRYLAEELKGLQFVGLHNCAQVTDDGVVHLARLSLTSLDLSGTSITPKALTHLYGMRSLLRLGLVGVRGVSENIDAIVQLRANVQAVKVITNEEDRIKLISDPAVVLRHLSNERQ